MSDHNRGCPLHTPDRAECVSCNRSAIKQIACASKTLLTTADSSKMELITVGMYLGWSLILIIFHTINVRFLTELMSTMEHTLGSSLWVYAMVTASLLHAVVILLPLANKKIANAMRIVLCGMSAIFWTFSTALSVVVQGGPSVFSGVLLLMVILSWWLFMRSGATNKNSGAHATH